VDIYSFDGCPSFHCDPLQSAVTTLNHILVFIL